MDQIKNRTSASLVRLAASFALTLISLPGCVTTPAQVEAVRMPSSSPPAQEVLEVFSTPGSATIARSIEFGVAHMTDAKDLNCASLQDGVLQQEFTRTGYPAPGSAVTMKNTSSALLLVYLFGHVEFNRRNDQHSVERYFFPKIANDVKVPDHELTGKYAGNVFELAPGESASFVFPSRNSDPTAETFVRLSCKTVESIRDFLSFGYGTMIEWNSGLQ